MKSVSDFSNTYIEARLRILEASRRHHSQTRYGVDTREHPSAYGPSKERLFTDLIWFGDFDATDVFVITCGTHGIEGFAGSAVLTQWLESSSLCPPKNCKVVIIHAVNPWGFAHNQRVTEGNVDLNRNFIDFSEKIPFNKGYEFLHPLLMLDCWSERSLSSAFSAMNQFRINEGEKSFSDAFNGGQYSHPDGLFYGGSYPEWSNTNFRSLLTEHLKRAKRVHLLDLHTGIGPYGKPFFINFDSPESHARKRVEEIWGVDAFSVRGSTHAAFATYQGLLMNSVCEELPHVETSAVVVEFGTHPREKMQRAHLGLAWLRRNQEKVTSESLIKDVMDEYKEAFIPSDPVWRESVIRHGTAICNKGFSALTGTVG